MKNTVLTFGIMVILAGCNEVSNTGGQRIKFTSEPANVLAVFSDNTSCNTPCSRSISGKEDLDIVFSHKNETREVTLTSGVRKDTGAEIVGNLLFGSPVGIVINGLSGKYVGFDTDHVHVDFTK